MLAIHDLLASLATDRPVFHSEADFQHALAWLLHQRHPELAVRLEVPVRVGHFCLHIDVMALSGTIAVAMEIKYKTRAASSVVGAEAFRLTSQAAQDLGRYDFVKDIERLERVAAERPGTIGYAVLLTNDQSYWKAGRPGSLDEDFRLHDGRRISGTLNWGTGAAAGTIRGREAGLTLCGSYQVAWKDYSEIGPNQRDRFRYLTVVIPGVPRWEPRSLLPRVSSLERTAPVDE